MGSSSGGARVGEIEKAIQPPIRRRTLQRYLAELRRQGCLRLQAYRPTSRNIRYLLLTEAGFIC